MGVWWANGPAGFEASQFQAPTGSQNEGNERGNETLSSENGDVAVGTYDRFKSSPQDNRHV